MRPHLKTKAEGLAGTASEDMCKALGSVSGSTPSPENQGIKSIYLIGVNIKHLI